MVVVQKPALRDNYAFLMHDPATGATAAIDTPEVGPIDEAVKEQGWNLTHILNTHHHWVRGHHDASEGMEGGSEWASGLRRAGSHWRQRGAEEEVRV